MEEIKRQKAKLRKRILKERSSLSEEQRHRLDLQILERLIRMDEENPCSVYLCYVNYKSEVSTKEFILWCLERGKIVFVPKVKTEAETAKMEFYQIRAWDELKAGYQGILEPEALPERKFSGWVKKMKNRSEGICFRMLIPGAVFDKSGNRIGYGGGFYDRWLAKWEDDIAAEASETTDLGKRNRTKCRIEKIGVAYGMQVTNRIATESFDKKLDFVLTEKEEEKWIF